MNWRWIKAFPKYALVFGGDRGEHGWFCVLVVRAFDKEGDSQQARCSPVAVEDIGPKLALVEAKHDRLILVDNDLYDLDSGAVIFKSWLKEGMPQKLFYDGLTQRQFVAQYERGFVRYGLNGAAEATLARKISSSSRRFRTTSSGWSMPRTKTFGARMWTGRHSSS